MGGIMFCFIIILVGLILNLLLSPAPVTGREIAQDCYYEDNKLIFQFHGMQTPKNMTCNVNCQCDGSGGYVGCQKCCCQRRIVEEKDCNHYIAWGVVTTVLMVVVPVTIYYIGYRKNNELQKQIETLKKQKIAQDSYNTMRNGHVEDVN